MNQYQNPVFGGNNPSPDSSVEPITPQNQEPVFPQEGTSEVLRVWDAHNQQSNDGGVMSEREEATPQDQVPSLSEQPQTPEMPETDNPQKFIQDNTPGNPDLSTPPSPTISPDPERNIEQQEVSPQQSVTNPKVEEEETSEDLRQELNSVKQELDSVKQSFDSLKTLLSDSLAGRKIKDFTDYPSQEPKILTSSPGREMILPLGTITVKFGNMEFKKALENAISLDEKTYILRYMSERPREDESQPEPRLLKFTKEQIDKCNSKIQQEDQQTQIAGQQQPPPAQQF